MRRIAFINEKGGTCKTTLAVNIAAWLAQERRHAGPAGGPGHPGPRGQVAGPGRAHAAAATSSTCSPTRPCRFDGRGAAHRRSRASSSCPPTRRWPSFPRASWPRTPRRAHRLAERLARAEAAGYDVVVFDAPPSHGAHHAQHPGGRHRGGDARGAHLPRAGRLRRGGRDGAQRGRARSTAARAARQPGGADALPEDRAGRRDPRASSRRTSPTRWPPRRSAST